MTLQDILSDYLLILLCIFLTFIALGISWRVIEAIWDDIKWLRK